MTSPPENQDRQLEYLSKIPDSLKEARDFNAILNSIAKMAAEATHCQASYVLLPQKGFLIVSAGHPSIPHGVAPIPIDESYTGWVYQFSHRLSRSKKLKEPLEFPPTAQRLGFEIENILAAPMISRGETLGVLEVINKSEDEKFTSDDQTIVDNLSLLAAMTVRAELSQKSSQLIDEKLEELERLKSNFVAIASHELRTPLGLIVGHATFLSEIVGDEDFKQQLSVIIRNASRLKDVIEDLSKVDNYQTGNIRVRQEKIDLKTLILEGVATIEADAKSKKITISTRIPEDCFIIQGEPEKIKIALGNIIDNAITFTNNGGQIEVVLNKLSGYAKVSVSDNGIGIPARDLQKVFDRFYQVEDHLTRHHDGMGLGLSVAKAMIEAHNGIIWVESIENEGSTFSFLLPLNPD